VRPIDPRDVFFTPPAPVYTGIEDYDAPRRWAEEPRRPRGARRAVMLFALVCGVWLLALAASQATSATVAVPFLERTISALGNVPELLRLRERQIRDAANHPDAKATLELPGFPIPGVMLARELAQQGSLDDWRAALLHDGAVAVYERGPAAFAPQGVEITSGLFSTSAWLKAVMGLMSPRAHFAAWVTSCVLGLGAAALAMLVWRRAEGARRFVAIGLGLLGGALVATALGLVGLLLAWLLGISTGSPFVDEIGGLILAIAWTPMVEALCLGAAGLAIALPATVVVWMTHAEDDADFEA